MTRFSKLVYIQALPNGEIRIIEPPMHSSDTGLPLGAYYDNYYEQEMNINNAGANKLPQSKPAQVQKHISTPTNGLSIAPILTSASISHPDTFRKSVTASQLALDTTRTVLEWSQKAPFYTTALPVATSVNPTISPDHIIMNPVQSRISQATATVPNWTFLQSHTERGSDVPATAANKERVTEFVEMSQTASAPVSLITDSYTAPPPNAKASRWSDYFGTIQTPISGPTSLPVDVNNRGSTPRYEDLAKAKQQSVIIGAVLGSICGLIILMLVLIIGLNYKRWKRFRLEKKLYGHGSRYESDSDLSQSSSTERKQCYKADSSVDTVIPPGDPIESPFDDADLLKIGKLMAAAPPLAPQNKSRISRLYQACMRSAHSPTRVVSAPSCLTDPLHASLNGFIPTREAPAPPGVGHTEPKSSPSTDCSSLVVSTLTEHVFQTANRNGEPELNLPAEASKESCYSGKSSAHSSFSNGTRPSGIYHLSDFTSQDEWGALSQFLFKSPNNSARNSQKTQERRPFWRRDLVSSLTIRNSSSSQPKRLPSRSSSIYSYYDIEELEHSASGVKPEHILSNLPPLVANSTSFDFANESIDDLRPIEPGLPIFPVIHQKPDMECDESKQT